MCYMNAYIIVGVVVEQDYLMMIIEFEGVKTQIKQEIFNSRTTHTHTHMQSGQITSNPVLTGYKIRIHRA